MDNQKRTAVVSALFEKKNKRKPKNSKELLDFVKSQGGDEFLKKVDEYIALAEKEQANQAKKAAHGIKLNFIKSLKHQCPEGEELYYYKKGGMVECGCKGKRIMEEGGTTPSVVLKFKTRKAGFGTTLIALADLATKGGFSNAKKKKEEKKEKAPVFLGKKLLIVGKTTIGDNTPETEEQKIYNSGKETVWESSLPKKKPQSKSCGGAVAKFKNRKK